MILDEILAHKRQEVAERKRQHPLPEIVSAAKHPPGISKDAKAPPAILSRATDPLESALAAESGAATSDRPGGSASSDPVRAPATSPHGANTVDVRTPSTFGFSAVLRQPGVSLIAEFKRRSPSGGELRPGAAAAELAALYAANGAAALSVLTDRRYFGGYDSDLVEARAASRLPALRKDFVVDPYQLYEAQAIGADAVLLIVRTLADAELRQYLRLAHDLGLDALVETHSADEVARARAAGATLIGVNNRDLDTLVTDINLCLRLRALVPPECVFVAESGISTVDHMRQLADAGVDAVLIGEALVRAPDPGAKLHELLAAGRCRPARCHPEGASAAGAARPVRT